MRKKNFCIAACLLIAFVAWTAAVQNIDVQPIGPLESCVGFAKLNRFIHQLTGVHMSLYVITDWLGLVPLVFAFGFAGFGFVQWIQRKKLWKVDSSILILGGFYIVVMTAYLFFESYVVNYRPVLINNFLEASYPSSTTLLVLCVMPTAMTQLKLHLKNKRLRQCINTTIAAFIAFMVIGRLISGVHWFSDIIGGALLSAGLVMLHNALVEKRENPDP